MNLKRFEFYTEHPEELKEMFLEYTQVNTVSNRSCCSKLGFCETTLRNFLKSSNKSTRLTLVRVYNFLKRENDLGGTDKV